MTCDRWRKWVPTEEQKPDLSEIQETRSLVGFVGSESVQMEISPVSWGEEFHRWAMERCVYRDRCFGGIGSLHNDFCEWIVNIRKVVLNNESLLTRAGFSRQIIEEGFFVADGLVSGLTLAEIFICTESEPPKPTKPCFVEENKPTKPTKPTKPDVRKANLHADI